MRSFRLPELSESTPTGNENRIPASGETAAISPITASSAPSACEKSDSTGFFEIVVENIAKKPSRNRYQTMLRSGENFSCELILVGDMTFRYREYF
jgi:hypothetical protein